MDKTINWLLQNINENEGVVISNNNRMSYPEVSGYLIPTLLNLGYKEKALAIGNWLAKIQNEDGSIPLGPNKFTFDTAMVLSGWQALGGFKSNRDKACRFLLSQIKDTGQFSVEFHDKLVPEKILIWSANLLEKEGYDMSRVWLYYDCEDTFKFDCLSHFHCYVLDATLNTPLHSRSVEAINTLSTYQNINGSIPAYSDVSWLCYTGIAQAALLFYKIGLITNGNKAMDYLEGIISGDGGILGSNGDYFSGDKLSWAAKFYVDAYQMMIEKHMDVMANDFPNWVGDNDVRRFFLNKYIGSGKILDLGCGRGKYEASLCGDRQYYGIDIADSLVEYCKNNVPNFVEVKKGLITNIPYEDEFFDCAFSVEVFEHASYLIENAIKETCRVLKSGGKFILIDKSIDFVGNREKWENWFSKTAVEVLLKKYFKEVSVHQLDGQFLGWVGYK